ncbi:uncharacterized protein LOC122638871 isoform X2 [Telopea speciosissima]|uniref:uncharacterized protein LOC122638871 isoform X2 n=1 Tax=Telopea speciosissima TaxID=54955 RepID=UPI001CC4ADFA|nr:uncharacterized protein LOC122638871 isoform X2 [Telopea speciosissima]
MELLLPATEIMSITRFQTSIKDQHLEKLSLNVFFNVQAQKRCKVLCLASRERRGFGPQPTEKDKINKVKAPREEMGIASQPRKSTSKQSGTIPSQAPGLSSQSDGRSSNIVLDRQFEERLEAVRRSAIKQKKAEEIKQYGTIDYDAPVESGQSTIGFGTKVGVGVAVVVFGLVFALGDFLPSGSVNPTEETAVVEKKLTEEEKTTLKTRLQEYEAMLGNSPKDPIALEGAAVTLVELGEYGRAASFLDDLTKESPSDPEAYRLLGEVKYELKDYEGSASAYRSSASVSKTVNFEILRGLTNTLLAAKKPDEAVQVLLKAREQLKMGNLNGGDVQVDAGNNLATEMQKVDPIQVELLLGKAYSDWGHISDAVSVYEQLISTHPDDFRGYLAKGIILKENGKVGDAERMFIQCLCAGTVLCTRESEGTC